MTVVTSRADFEKLMDLRMKEAKLLLDQKDWDGAYYLSGYAVEFATKLTRPRRKPRTCTMPSRRGCCRGSRHVGRSPDSRWSPLRRAVRRRRQPGSGGFLGQDGRGRNLVP